MRLSRRHLPGRPCPLKGQALEDCLGRFVEEREKYFDLKRGEFEARLAPKGTEVARRLMEEKRRLMEEKGGKNGKETKREEEEVASKCSLSEKYGYDSLGQLLGLDL